VYNRTRRKAETLAVNGAQMADRIADIRRGEALITMLADDPGGGALSALGRNPIHISEQDQPRTI
jgi:hypothetical protein